MYPGEYRRKRYVTRPKLDVRIRIRGTAVHEPYYILHTAAAERSGHSHHRPKRKDFLVVADDANIEDAHDEQKGMQSHRNMNLLAVKI